MPNQASATKLLADTLSDLGEFDRSIELYNEARGCFRQLGDEVMVATIDMEMGIVLQGVGRFSDARECYEVALEQFREMIRQRNLDIARCQQNLSCALQKLGEIEQTRAALREAREFFLQSKMVREVADCDVNLGNALWHQGQLAEARELNESAQRVYKKLGLLTEAADCTDHIGGMLIEQGEYSAALPYHRRARAVYDEYYFAIDSAISTCNYAIARYNSIWPLYSALNLYSCKSIAANSRHKACASLTEILAFTG